MGTRSIPYTVDTKGSCLLCLKLTEDAPLRGMMGSGAGVDPANKLSTVYYLGKLTSHLKLDFQKVFNIGSGSMPPQLLENAEIRAPLCRHCASQTNMFMQLASELERIQNLMKVAVRTISSIMEESEGNPMRKLNYLQRLATSDPLQIIQSSIVERLRRELMDKCSDSKRKVPSLKLLESRGLSVNPVSGRNGLEVPHLRSFQFPPATRTTSNANASILRRRPGPPAAVNNTRPRPPPPALMNRISGNIGVGGSPPVFGTGNTTANNKSYTAGQQVEVVELDISDSEEQEEDSGIVISSVTGANGLTISSTPPTPIVSTEAVNQPSRVQPPPPLASSVSPSTESKENRDVAKQTAISEADSFLDSLFGIGSSGGNATSTTGLNPPSRRNNLTEVGKDDIYTIFDNGRCQCGICGKILGNLSTTKEAHKLIHLNKKPLKCIHCPARFRNISNLKAHITGLHRPEMLGNFRKEQVAPEVFRRIVLNFFRLAGKSVDEQGNLRPSWPCKYCQKVYKNKHDMEGHLIQLHYDVVGAELQQMQDNPSMLPDLTTMMQSSSNNILPAMEVEANDGGNNGLTQYGFPGPSSAAVKQPPSTIQLPQNLYTRCRICNKICQDRIDLRRHYVMFHNVGKSTALKTSMVAKKGTTPTGIGCMSCPHCSKRFRFQHSVRAHVLSAHPVQVFRKHISPGNTDQAIETELTNIMNQEFKDLGSDTFGCNYCPREFTEIDKEHQLIKNHVMQNHIEKIVPKMQAKLGSRPIKRRKEMHSPMKDLSAPAASNVSIIKEMLRAADPSPPATPNPTTTASSSSSPPPVGPVRNVKEENVEILPD